MLDKLNHSELECLYHFCDSALQLEGYIAIHSTQLGPALGGTRCLSYASNDAAIADAVNLARGMTYKAALASLPYGGGKAVLLAPAHIVDRQAYFGRYGEFVQALAGQFITSVDSGTCPADVAYMAQSTHYVSNSHTKLADPSPYTALGIMSAIRVAASHAFNRDSLNGLSASVQGAGHVGSLMTKHLSEAGASVSVSDIFPNKLDKLINSLGDRHNAKKIGRNEPIEADIFCPCALGGCLSVETIPKIHSPLIAGAANNQLASSEVAALLYKRGTLYLPDYAINAGGLIYIHELSRGKSDTEIENKVSSSLSALVSQLLARSKDEQLPPATIADDMAKSRLQKQAEEAKHHV